MMRRLLHAIAHWMSRAVTRALPYGLYAVLVMTAVSPASAAVRASVDNTQVAPGDTVELTLSHDGQTGTQPDLSPLKQDFDIVGRSSNSRVQITNGRISSTVELTLSLAPKHAGQLTIPSIAWDSDRSAPLTVAVGAGGGGANGAAQGAVDNRILLETESDPKSPYLQGAVHVTARIYAAVPLSQANLEFPTSDVALVKQVGSDDSGVSEKNGQSYQVVTRHYLVFPQHSGHLSIPGPVLSGAIPARTRHPDPNDPFSGFFGRSPFGGMLGASKPIRLNGDPIVLDVLPRPAGAGANYWLPARNLTLSAQWRPTDLQAHVGDPVTVNLHLQAEDLTAAQLPDLSTLLTLPPGIKAYPDEPKLKDSAQAGGIVADREQNIALIAEQPGQFTIPELRLTWWDTRANQAREAVMPARTLVVQPSAGSTTTAQTASPTTQTGIAGQLSNQAPSPASNITGDANGRPRTSGAAPGSSSTTALGALTAPSPWLWVSIGLAILWIATLISWLRLRRRATAASLTALREGHASPSDGQTETTSASSARSAFQAACRANDASTARRTLLAWANAALPSPRIAGLNDLAKRLEDPQVANLLRALDRGCYGGETWDGAALASAIPKLPLGKDETEPRRRDLAPLYH
jgi:hypothetical protein